MSKDIFPTRHFNTADFFSASLIIKEVRLDQDVIKLNTAQNYVTFAERLHVH